MDFKGKSYTFNLSSEETYPTDEIVPTTMDATPIDTPVEIDENTDKDADQIETTPATFCFRNGHSSKFM